MELSVIFDVIFMVCLGVLVLLPFYKLGLAFRPTIDDEVLGVRQNSFRLAKFDNKIWRHLVVFTRIAKSFNNSAVSIIIVFLLVIMAGVLEFANLFQIILLSFGLVLMLCSAVMLFWVSYSMSDMIAVEKRKEEYAVKKLLAVNTLTSVISVFSTLVFFSFIFLVFPLEIFGVYAILAVLIFLFTSTLYFNDPEFGKE